MVEEQKLVKNCLDGDHSAFEQLVEKYEDRIFNSVLQLVKNVEDAKDVVQDVFLIAYEALPRFRGDSRLWTWLYRIAYNVATNLKRSRMAAYSIHNDDSRDWRFDVPTPINRDQPWHRLVRLEEDEQVRDTLNQLPEKDRELLILRHVMGFKYKRIASLLLTPIGTVRSRLHRARSAFRRLLREISNETMDATSLS